MENPVFAALVRKINIPKSVEELSTYPHSPWITRQFAEIVGIVHRPLRHLSTAGRAVPISPTHCTRIIHKVGDLSTENGRLSPEDVERHVLRFVYALVKWMRTYYAFKGGAARRTKGASYPLPVMSTNGRWRCG